jgi:hypothetical protein
MIDEKKKDLARRAVACPGWRWMPGMLLVSAAKDMRPMRLVEGGRAFLDLIPSEAWLPDLDDPATLGCLLALVREAWPMAPATTSRHVVAMLGGEPRHEWVCSICVGPCLYASNGPAEWRQASGATEAEALVAALEAAGR